MSVPFVHLRLHTEYSLVDGIVRIKELVATARDAGMPAVAVTDQCNLFALVKFYRAAQAAGIKPVVGADLWLHNPAEPARPHRLTLLCQHYDGYRNLAELVSQSYLEGWQHGRPTVAMEWLEPARCEGLIALSGGRHGDVGRALLSGDTALANGLLDGWLARFPDRYYLELNRTGREDEERALHASVALAAERGVPVVATNDVRFLRADDFEAHEVRHCIHEGRTLDDRRRERPYSAQQYLRTPQEMAECFADLPEALANSVAIAERCNLELQLGENVLPDFPVPEGMTIDAFFAEEARRGLAQRLALLLPEGSAECEARRAEYHERLALEIDVISAMGFPGYFLIVADFIRWAKQQNIPVGPGRGSGAGSLVAYALEITDLDPIAYDLLFERFLNPERVSMPDFDVDFCMDRRDEVIDYVARRYGRDHVSQIITYGSMAAKAVVRDVGRVLGHLYGFVDSIAKLIPFELGITLEKALEQEEALRERYENEEDVQALIDMARKLEGLSRNAGKHAGGVVIAPSKLTDFAPLYCEQGSESVVTQFDKDDVEAVGLVKFDFLGLRTLTIIQWALENIARRRGEAPDMARIPLDDPAAFALLKQCQTTAVFQLESRGMKDLIKRLQPDCFEEIIALVALFRPGPLQSGMVDDFINRKHGRATVEYPHPDLEPILQPTYGIILYQEQVMQIAQVLAGYTLGGADLLRRAMGKKKPEEMAKQRAIFVEGATARGVAEATATYIFDLMEKFAGYGFNKSHSAAYALVSYQTAWLKAHYPAEFMAAVLSADMDNTDKVVNLIEECRSMGLEVLPPHVNQCSWRFAVAGDGQVRYGLGAIKGLGEGAVGVIEAAREADGAFTDLADFCRRIDPRSVGKRAFEVMIRAGALDGLGPNRASLMAGLPTAVALAERLQRDDACGQVDLFGEAAAVAVPAISLPEVGEWSDEVRLAGEKETLGLYLTGHPFDRYRDELAHIARTRIADLRPQRDQAITIAGLVVALRTMNTRSGDKMAIVTLDDRSGRIEVTLFADLYAASREQLAIDRVVVVEGEVSHDDYSGGNRLRARQVCDIATARARHARGLVLTVQPHHAGNGLVRELEQALLPFRDGGCRVWIDYSAPGAAARLTLGEGWRVQPSDELLHRLAELIGPEGVRMEYPE